MNLPRNVMIIILPVIVAGLISGGYTEEVALTNFTHVELEGIDTQAGTIRTTKGPALEVRFDKDATKPRLLAMAAEPQATLMPAKSVYIDCQLDLTDSNVAPSLAIVLFDADGGAWYQKVAYPADKTAFTTVQAPIQPVTEAAFSHDKSGQLQWPAVKKVWLGLILDGPAAGRFTVRSARISTSQYTPDSPLQITRSDNLRWTLMGKHKQVEPELTTPSEGPDGRPCMKLQFQITGNGHRFCLPFHPVPRGRVAGYTAIQFDYTAQLPKRIEGILLHLRERDGSVYIPDPLPPPTNEWKTLTIPLGDFVLGGWSEDENDTFDLATISGIVFGFHGSATGQDKSGTIRVANIKLLPPQ